VRLDSIAVVARFHALRTSAWDAWVGLGWGREWLNFAGRLPITVTADPIGPREPTPEPQFALTGWRLDVRAGLDYLPLAWMRVGAFAIFASGRYSERDVDGESCGPRIPCVDVDIDEPAFHHWTGIGLRFAVVLPEPSDD
jgi:hypothetical protein